MQDEDLVDAVLGGIVIAAGIIGGTILIFIHSI